MAGPQSAKADFVPFQRRVSNPSGSTRRPTGAGPMLACLGNHPVDVDQK